MNMPNATAAPSRPVAAGLALARTISDGDLGSASACFLRDGCLITPDATAVHGRDQIRPVLAQLIARRTEIEVECSSLINAGDAVLAYERWEVRSSGIGRSRVAQTWNPTLVLRRSGEEWRLAIAAPWGWGQAGA
jgi:ketosteroid isomerase-like protein